MSFKTEVYLGIAVTIVLIIAAFLAILLDKGSYARSYRRWKRGK